uniref:putative pumilio homolog 8, chloroplastic n=1 Tax=Erigeron canadensis TaxID=72917 RepID=UPI001CB9576D|nr:putative pumilio homolog 8, chloroplastic [Erigeron canadensis]
MVEKIEISTNENMKDDDELEMLLGEIPHATSLLTHNQNNNHHYDHSLHVNDNDNDYGYESSYPLTTMNPLMYGMYQYHDNPSCSSSSIQSNGSFSSHFSKEDDDHPTPKPDMLFRSYSSILPYTCLGKKIDDNLGTNPISFGKPFLDYGLIQSHTPRNHTFNRAMSPNFSLHQTYGFPQSSFNRNMLNIRHPISYQRVIPALDLAVSNDLYRVRRNVMLEASDDSVNVGRVRNGGFRGHNKKCNHSQLVGRCENGRISITNRSCPTPVRCNTLADVKGYIYMFAKDQNGCRFIQSVFEVDNQEHVKIIFDETIGHVSELMVNSFGNYLMQKLLEVCNEEQRMCILMEVTREPRDLVHISLNPHGTRAVQKLIETLKTRKQIKMVISALEPGFLALIKDLNGNHVIQRCLQCLSNEDNKFIFEAAAKFCVDIATHQHGCCVLQRCINHSSGKHQERLVLEISSNGLLLAQDAFGNYVVQSILELQIPSAISMLTSQFENNYVHLATQKFSSHVVEKCLSVLDDHTRSIIIRELLSATHFEQLLQDPHANYVIQTALRVSEGSLHNSLVKAIESHKAISRNSPYSKRIFSHKLLKK